jgi:RimJ/RimL family protein N-acetyltransferase
MTNEPTPFYPAQYESEFLLSNGARILIRPIRKEDAEHWVVFVNKLSPDSKYLRFHSVPKVMSTEDAMRFCTVDYVNSFALIAEVIKGQNREIVAIGRYYKLPNKDSAEVAIVTEDAYQKMGIGTNLIRLLAKAAHDNGVKYFEAEILADNQKAMNFFERSGFHISRELKYGEYHVTFPV